MKKDAEKTMKKVHLKQHKFHSCMARNRWIFGGNRTGKTHCGAQEAVWWACCTHLERIVRDASDGWVVSLSCQVQRDVAQRKILDMLNAEVVASKAREDENLISYECTMLKGKSTSPYRGVIDFITVKNIYGTESRIGFKNCEQGREKFQGTGLDWVWFDEEPSEDIYDECIMRTLDKGGSAWGTMTPLKGRTWVYEKIFLPADSDGSDINLITMSWEDNPYLDKKEIARMEKNYSMDALESRKHGRFTEGSGLVFKEFGEENIVKNVSTSSILETAVYTGISIDPGYTNPTAVLWFAVDGDRNIFVVDDYKQSGRSVQQIAGDIHNKSEEIGIEVRNVFIDSAASARTLGDPRSVADQFRGCGVNVSTEVYKNVKDGLHRVKSLFCSADGTRKIFVLEHCMHLINELRTYFWNDNEQPHKSNDHCIDALRYFVMSAYDDTPRKQKKTTIEKFKRSLIRK